jgi:cytochrome c oxidase subunit 3
MMIAGSSPILDSGSGPPPDELFADLQLDRHDLPKILRRYRLGLALYIASVVMLLVGFSSAYIVRRGIPTYEAATDAYSASWEPLKLPVALLVVNTLLLVGASIAMEIARRKSQVSAFSREREKHRGSGWISFSLLLSLGFVMGQGIAWHRLRLAGLFMSSGPRTAFFYVLTGTHAFHAIVVIAVLAWIAVRQGHWLPFRQYVAVDLSACYLHSMTVLWIYLFCFLLFA